jgi:hypothetical protein
MTAPATRATCKDPGQHGDADQLLWPGWLLRGHGAADAGQVADMLNRTPVRLMLERTDKASDDTDTARQQRRFSVSSIDKGARTSLLEEVQL